MNIRRATADDTPSLNFLRQERAVLLQQSDPRLGAFLNTIARTADFSALLTSSQPDSHGLFVGELNPASPPRVVGYILGMVSLQELPTNIGLILDLALDAHQYHAGLGRQLYTQLRAWFSDQPIHRLWVPIPRYHAVEQAFWRSIATNTLNIYDDPHLLALHTALAGQRSLDWIDIPL